MKPIIDLAFPYYTCTTIPVGVNVASELEQMLITVFGNWTGGGKELAEKMRNKQSGNQDRRLEKREDALAGNRTRG